MADTRKYSEPRLCQEETRHFFQTPFYTRMMFNLTYKAHFRLPSSGTEHPKDTLLLLPNTYLSHRFRSLIYISFK